MPKVSETYERLYHYTTLPGLHGILLSQSLWATHYKFLNDYSEVVLFKDKLISLTLPHVSKAYNEIIRRKPEVTEILLKHGGVEKVVEHDTKVFVDAQYHATGDEIYVLSFCGPHKDQSVNENGLLSQWRGYGVDGGFALVFSSKKLEDMIEREVSEHQYSVMHFSDVIYSDDEEFLQGELSDDLSIIAEDVKKFFNIENSGQQPEDFLLEGFSSFVYCVTRYKHYGFNEENEVRIVVLPTTVLPEPSSKGNSSSNIAIPEKERKYRDNDGGSIPYIEMFKSIDLKLPIEKIIVGPHKDKEKRASALRTMLRSTNIEITCSEIPYVN